MQAKLALAGLGTLIGIIIALVGFRVLVGDLRLVLAYFYDDAVVFRNGNGDILFWQSEFVEPLDNPEKILSVHRLRADEDGFRLPENPSDTYEVVVLGDSYTEGANVARPWPDVFADASGLSTRNLGFRGYGLQHYAWVWEQFGREENPDVVIVGFFGGNDVLSAGLDHDEFTAPRENAAEQLDLELVIEHQELENVERVYPVTLLNGQPITFLTTYVSWMNVALDHLTGSENYRVIEENLRNIRESVPAETCLIFAYVPSKPEVYFPYVKDDDYSQILDLQKTVLINDEGKLHLVGGISVDREQVLIRRVNTGNVFTELAESIGYKTVNLLDIFDQQAAQGEMLYYTYDTHWNQAGQTLAGEALADFVTMHCPDN